MATVTGTKLTADDLLGMPDGNLFELVDGELVELSMGARSSEVGLQLGALLLAHCKTTQAGKVFGADCGYQCFSDDPERVRRPDSSFVRAERFRDGAAPGGFIKFAPDIAAEVLSPKDRSYDVDTKVAEYLQAGVQLVWVIHPKLKTVYIHRSNGSVTALNERDELSGEDVLPGFRCRVADLFC